MLLNLLQIRMGPEEMECVAEIQETVFLSCGLEEILIRKSQKVKMNQAVKSEEINEVQEHANGARGA